MIEVNYIMKNTVERNGVIKHISYFWETGTLL